jgi:hypothetical protein
VRENGRCLTSGVAAFKCEVSVPGDDGIHATETFKSKGGDLRNLRSHRVRTCALLLVLF